MAEDASTASAFNILNHASGKNSVRAVRHASTFAEPSNTLRKRRSSTFSDSLDEARQSLRSSTDDLLLPRPRRLALESQEHSHWHSAPLALALLPAVGGLLFQNGSAVVTDVTLLGLAAVFLNWSVRLPWHWYHSAQSTEPLYPPGSNDHYTNGTIVEEASEDEKPSTTSSPAVEESNNQNPKPIYSDSPAHASALSELRFHELLALFACFIFPLVGAWLLHTIRCQLSRPSEGLVSNYNLTIFLLASELRPISHLIKLIQARTLFLQGSLHPHRESPPPASQLLELTSRLSKLETTLTTLNPSPSPSLPTDVRKSIQPDLDALNRAVRRYEKRATLLSMQTESRLQDLEARLCDALTLAAAAERSSSAAATGTTGTKSTHGSALILLDWICATVVLPIQAVWWTCAALPLTLAQTALSTATGYFTRKRTVQPQSQPTKPPLPRSSASSGGGTVYYERKAIAVPRRGGGKKTM